MICGAPPVGHDQMSQGFKKSPHLGAAGKQELSEAQIKAFVEGVVGESAEPFLWEAVARTDGRFRKRLFDAARFWRGRQPASYRGDQCGAGRSREWWGRSRR